MVSHHRWSDFRCTTAAVTQWIYLIKSFFFVIIIFLNRHCNIKCRHSFFPSESFVSNNNILPLENIEKWRQNITGPYDDVHHENNLQLTTKTTRKTFLSTFFGCCCLLAEQGIRYYNLFYDYYCLDFYCCVYLRSFSHQKEKEKKNNFLAFILFHFCFCQNSINMHGFDLRLFCFLLSSR